MKIASALFGKTWDRSGKNRKMKRSDHKLLAVLLILSLTMAAFCGCAGQNGTGRENDKYKKYADMTAEEITAS
ncbi:MAG: hypothetical protein J5933_06065, partial [Clostridia bacterium]|nr:hypothetical protein [Clostridia bacterium]